MIFCVGVRPGKRGREKFTNTLGFQKMVTVFEFEFHDFHTFDYCVRTKKLIVVTEYPVDRKLSLQHKVMILLSL